MNARALAELPIPAILVPPDRLREFDKLEGEAIRKSIEARGLLHPIEVAARDADGRYRLLAGLHRLTACTDLGWQTIPAFVRPVADEREARLIEIEENLIRHELTQLDRAVFLHEWRGLYVAAEKPRKPGRPGKKDSESQFPLPFAEAVKERLKMTARSVNRAAARAGMAAELLAAVRRSAFMDHAGVLDALCRLDESLQVRVARGMAANMTLPEVRALIARVSGRQGKPERSPLDRVMAIWADATEEQKADIARFVRREAAAMQKAARDGFQADMAAARRGEEE